MLRWMPAPPPSARFKVPSKGEGHNNTGVPLTVSVQQVLAVAPSESVTVTHIGVLTVTVPLTAQVDWLRVSPDGAFPEVHEHVSVPVPPLVPNVPVQVNPVPAVTRLPGQPMVGGPEIVMLQQVEAEPPAASITLTQTEELNALVGVPDSTPVAVLSVIPAGSVLVVEKE